MMGAHALDAMEIIEELRLIEISAESESYP